MRTDYDDEPYTREEYQEHIRINKLSYRLPLVTDYIKNKLY